MKRDKPFATEADLCEAFAAWARADGLVVYPETAGWDMVLVHPEEQWQIGVEAKLSLNLKVMQQAIKGLRVYGFYGREHEGPDYRAVVVPEAEPVLEHFAATLGIEVFTPQPVGAWEKSGLKWRFSTGSGYYADTLPWFDHNPKRRLKLPDYVPDVPAGVPSPRTLSPWKVGALRVLAKLEIHGHVTREDIRDCKNDPRRWCASDGFLVQLGSGRWGRGPRTPQFDLEHPEVYPQVLQEMREKALGKAA